MPAMKRPTVLPMPTGVASDVKQDIYLLRDVSGSMDGEKLTELNMGSQDLLKELGNKENKDGFRFSCLDFNHEARWRMEHISAQEGQVPHAIANGGTDFNAPLALTLEALIARKNRPNPERWFYLRPFVLFLSDGHARVDLDLVAEVSEYATLMAIAYGADADQNELAKIASDGVVHRIGVDGGSLRQFFAEVGTTIGQERAEAEKKGSKG